MLPRRHSVGQTGSAVACILIALLSDGCASPAPDPRELVPNDSVATLHITWPEVRRDQALGKLVAGLNITETTSDYSQEPTYRGFSLRSTGDGTWVAQLHDRVVVAGSRSGVRRVIDVLRSRSQSMIRRQDVREVGNYGDRLPISLVVALPEHVEDITTIGAGGITALLNSSGLPEFGRLIQQLTAIRAVGLSVRRNGERIPVELRAMIRDEGTAQAGEVAMRLLSAGVKFGATQAPPLHIERLGRLLTARLELIERDLAR